MSAEFLDARLSHLLPAHAVGAVTSVSPVRIGLSGADVFAVTTERGEFILRIQSAAAGGEDWRQHLLVLRRASDAGIAPRIVHVDEPHRAIVSQRIGGGPLPSALADPAQRPAAISSVVAQMQAIHALNTDGIQSADAVAYARASWDRQSGRDEFPNWARGVSATLDRIAELLAGDTRRVVGHNDLNPSNILWDGKRAWVVDWDTAALAHPYYDVATFTLFLNLPDDGSHEILAAEQGRPVGADDRRLLARLKQLVAIVVGSTLLSLVPDLTVFPTTTIDDAPTLTECYAAMRTGGLDLQTPRGRARFGLAFVRIAATNG